MNRRITYLFSCFSIFILLHGTYAETQKINTEQKSDSLWQKELISKIHLSQSNYDNWATGAENTFSWLVKIISELHRDWSHWNWSNQGKFSYGKTKVGKQEARKSLDEIKIESVLSYKLGIQVNPYVAINIETQSTPGYLYNNGDKSKISDFFDPAFFRQSIGFGYTLKPVFKTRMGLAIRETITRKYWQHSDDPETEKIERIRTTMGLESVTDIHVKVNDNLVVKSKLQLFSDMNQVNAVDINWDNILSAKIARYFDVDFNLKLIYDKNVTMQRQIMQVLSLGLTYSFF